MQELQILSGLREVGIKLVEKGISEKGNASFAAVAADYLIKKLAIKSKPAISAEELIQLVANCLVASGRLTAAKSRPKDVMQYLHKVFGVELSRPLNSSFISKKLH